MVRAGGAPGRAIAAIAALLLVVAACGDNSLGELDVVEEWIEEARPPDVTRLDAAAIEVDPDQPRPIETISWYNGWEPVVATDPAEVVAQVWASSDGDSSFVQASPNEIGRALPGVKVPSLYPPFVVEITSQLVYAGTTGQLDQGVVAAFGLWSAPAYTVSRATGQVGVLTVAFEQEIPVDPADEAGGCGRFTSASFCEPAAVGTHPAWWVTDLDGESLVWLDTDYRYDLLRRPRLTREHAQLMADSMVDLLELQPAGAPAGG